jgi:acyl-CoA synthetase (AMP-forming)/AMP-acid ligase II
VTLLIPDNAVSSALLLGVAGAAIAVPLNPHAAGPELEALGDRLCPRLTIATGAGLIHADRLGPPVMQVEGADPRRLRLTPVHASEFHSPLKTTRTAEPNDVALVAATSGTTSAPRLVPLTHRNLISACANFARAVGLGASDVALNMGSLFHVMHLGNTLPGLLTGGATYVPSDRQPSMLWNPLIQHGITWVVGTPSHYSLLLEGATTQPGARPPTCLRLACSSAAPLRADHRAKLVEALGVPLLNLYGMSESLDMAMTRPGREFPAGALGQAFCEGLAIVDPCGQAVMAGATGEIVTRGAHVFPGYLDDPAATAVAFLPGCWFRTGDVGYVDESGVFFLTGRLHEIINRGGEKVAPAEVDNALLAHPDVVEAAAFGIPEARLGEEVAAAVVLKPGSMVTARELRRWVANLLTPHKIPRRILFVNELPRTATGKVQRGELARRCSEFGDHF